MTIISLLLSSVSIVMMYCYVSLTHVISSTPSLIILFCRFFVFFFFFFFFFIYLYFFFFFFQAEDGIRDADVTGVQTCALPISNLPQIRANLDDQETAAMARAFGVPVLLNSNLRDGSLRAAAADHGVRILLYEAGEALRYDELCIRAGERGTINVMRHLGMLPASRAKKTKLKEPVTARTSAWERATDSGFVQHHRNLGDRVKKQELLATIRDPYGTVLDQVYSRHEGIIIGKQKIPLVQEGEAMYHVAYFRQPDDVVEGLEQLQDLLPADETLR